MVAVAGVILLLILGYMGIACANDQIAYSMEETLLTHPLPPRAELLDSKAIAGKLDGNGNGMQYRGMLLIASALPEEAIEAHYASLADGTNWVFVYPQESQRIFEYDCGFDVWTDACPCWRVELYRDSIAGCEETLWEALLNSDLRGH